MMIDKGTKMDAILRELEGEFGISIATAAEKIGRIAESKNVPVCDAYAIVTHATLLFAATMSRGNMTREEFMTACGMVFDETRRRTAALTKGKGT